MASLFSNASNTNMLAKSAFDELFDLSNNIVQGKMLWYFYQAWNGTSLTALNKEGTEELNEGETMDCRPVCKGESPRKVITKVLYSPCLGKIREKCEPCQFGIGTNGGGSQLVMAITLLLEAHPSWVVIALDIVNALNEIERQSILEAIWDDEEIRPLWYYNMRCMTVTGFISDFRCHLTPGAIL